MPAAVVLLAAAAWGQPLLLIGKSDAELSGAFAYGFLESPLAHPFDEGAAAADFNLPIRISAQANRFLGSAADSAVVMPDLFARVSQQVNAHLTASAPVPGGVAFFAARENAGLSVTGALGDARFNLDTTLDDAGSILLRGAIHMPLTFSMEWRSLTFGYACRPARYLALGFQIHRHDFIATTAGDLRPDLAGWVRLSGDGGNAEFPVEYPDDKVYGSARGRYEGTAWSPDLAVAVGPVRLTSRMGARMEARGRLDLAYGVPFFIDPGNFEPRFTEPDSFLAAGNLRRLLDGETGSRDLHIRDRLVLTLPQSHTLSIGCWKERLSLSYTKVFGRLSIRNQGAVEGAEDANGAPDSEGTGTGKAVPSDSGGPDTDGFVDLVAYPDQVIRLSARFSWFHADLGAHTLNLDYGGRRRLLSGISPLEWGGDPIVPILDFGFAWGHPLAIHADFYVSPLPAVRSGVSYVF